MARRARSRVCSPTCSSEDRPRPRLILRATRSRRDRVLRHHPAWIACPVTIIMVLRHRGALDLAPWAEEPVQAARPALVPRSRGAPTPPAWDHWMAAAEV